MGGVSNGTMTTGSAEEERVNGGRGDGDREEDDAVIVAVAWEVTVELVAVENDDGTGGCVANLVETPKSFIKTAKMDGAATKGCG